MKEVVLQEVRMLWITDHGEETSGKVVALFQSERRCDLLPGAGKGGVRRQFSNMKVRRIVNDVLGTDICAFCGAPWDQGATGVSRAEWYTAPGCGSCGASNLA